MIPVDRRMAACFALGFLCACGVGLAFISGASIVRETRWTS